MAHPAECDGAHATDACPHFPKVRDEHRDAWDNHSTVGGGAPTQAKAGCKSAAPPEVLRSARVVRQPGDGSCLYHSMAYGLGQGYSAASLRQQLADTVEARPTKLLAGTPLRDWVQWDSGLSPTAYASKMRSAGQWGGAIELALMSELANACVYVYEPCVGGFQRISAFEPNGEPEPGQDATPRRTVRLLYGGRVHYDALVL